MENVSSYFKSFFNFPLFSDNLGTKTETETLPYIPPLPERGSGVHRVVGVLVKNFNNQQHQREY